MSLTTEQSEEPINEQPRASDRRLAEVPQEHVRIVLRWFAEVFERALQEAVDLDQPSASEIAIPDEPHEGEGLVHYLA